MVGKLLIYGGKGALGSTLIKHFKEKKWWIVNVDLDGNEEANANILINLNDSWTQQNEDIQRKVLDTVGSEKIDAIFCVAGGWAGGNAASNDFVKNADLMWKQSVWSSVIASSLASKHLKESGLLVLTGAQTALHPTPGMIGYGMAKASVHQLVKSLADQKSGLPKGSIVTAILPITLDTPMNRKFMPKADFKSWTSLEYIAELFGQWLCGQEKPENGALYELQTKDGCTKCFPV